MTVRKARARFRILGPVGVWRDEQALSVVGPKQRTLLALLVLQAGRTVSHDRLLAALWPGKAPATSRRLLHNYLWAIRRLLDDGNALVGTPTGYSLRLGPGDSDLDVFLTETAAGRSALAAGDAATASERLGTALALWRGAALDGTQPEFQATEGAALEESRIATLLNRIDADLILGRHAELVGELRMWAAQHPLNEGFQGRLMRALNRVGRTAEALEIFRITRTHFREELGLDPGEELVRLHQSMLSGDSGIDEIPAESTPPVSLSPSSQATAVPRQLPADVTRFVGRRDGLRELDLLLAAPLDGPPAVAIIAITGPPGVGKTALATRWGHRMADRFPDGQLYVNLHGHGPGQPVTTAQALDRLLRSLGVASDQIPQEPDARESMYRSLLADKRVLVLLDNAAGADQLRPLLPGSALCKVVITSRDSLRALSVTHDVHTVTLGMLSPREATALLVAILGEARLRDEVPDVFELIGLCGHLPLALRLAAAHLGSVPTLPISAFVARLRQENRLTMLEISEDPHIGVRAAFATSYKSLPAPTQRTFRLLGLHPGPDIGIEEAAALTGAPAEEVRALLDTLIGAHLVQRTAGGRFVMHDLINLFAGDCAESDETAESRRDALTRLFDWYLHTARAAMEQVYPDHSGIAYVSAPPPGIPVFHDYDSATAWLDVEYPALIAAVDHAAGHGWPDHAWQLAYTLDYFFYLRDRIDDWQTVLQTALSAVRRTGDRHGEGRLLNALGAANLLAGNIDDCLDHHRQALGLSRIIGDRRQEAYSLGRLGYALLWTGGFGEAIHNCTEAGKLFRAFDDDHGEMTVTFTLGIAHLRMGHPLDALRCVRSCLDFERRTGKRNDEAYTLTVLGEVYEALDDAVAADDAYQQSVRLNAELGNPRFMANATNGIGRIRRREERYDEALDHHRSALDQIRETGDQHAECEITMDLATTLLESGDARTALKHQSAALDVARTVRDPYLQGKSHDILARVLCALGRGDEASTHWQAALKFLSPMGVPEAAAIAKRIREAE
ncbi:SARP family transcriptional regulator [Sphaerisporangium rufum]|uniref:SARP family transcriptional regulator n=1 Tax=Sphaerisporangium rufum TaxID=1381558 RepID=A0A919UXZ8_9ACTN|nr:BTAD domain-containing putative transcriptional regulator [Sphaerisporangium rufum]GII76379.1 SARP family transcriptional regulator [Sphaerisporangium rufum]